MLSIKTMKVCGILMGLEKLRKFKATRLCESYSTEELSFIQLTSVDQLTDVKLDCLIQKLPEILLSCGDTENESVRKLQDFLHQNPNVVCIDRPENVQLLLRRDEQFQMIENRFTSSELADCVGVPKFCLLPSSDVQDNMTRLRNAHIRFPIITKPQVAHGDKTAHGMALVFSEKGLKEIVYPAIAQQFINHNGKLFKIFVIGHKTFVYTRPSIRNLHADSSRETILFDSRTVSKDGHNSPLCDVDTTDAHTNEDFRLLPDRAVFDRIAVLIREATKLELFGVDVIKCTSENGDEDGLINPHWAVIDVNVCPSYDTVPLFHQHLVNLVREKLSLPLLPITDQQ